MLPDTTAPLVFLHAHPDDETLTTGALIAALAAAGRRIAVVTATRGERGEIVGGVLPAGTTAAALTLRREAELAAALAELGVADHAFLGVPPARAAGREPRRYTDSGMRWVSETVAGPDADAGPDSLSRAEVGEAAADLSAYLDHLGAAALISYDRHGGYAHPDHIACHRIAAETTARTGIAAFELVSEPLLPNPDAHAFVHPEQRASVRRALAHYRTQLRLDGDEIVHVGGQRQAIATTCWLARG